jgi:hypothetical protein
MDGVKGEPLPSGSGSSAGWQPAVRQRYSDKVVCGVMAGADLSERESIFGLWVVDTNGKRFILS